MSINLGLSLELGLAAQSRPTLDALEPLLADLYRRNPDLRRMEHQAATVNRSWDEPAWALHLDCGLGKSFCTLLTMMMLWRFDMATHAMVFAPKSVLRNWMREIDKFWLTSPEIPKPQVHLWKRAGESEMLDRSYPDRMRIFLMGTEVLSSDRSRGAAVAEQYLRIVPGGSMMVIDESSQIKEAKSERTKRAVKLGAHADYRRVLSGLPNPNSPLDIYAPFCFLSGEGKMSAPLLGHHNLTSFKYKYAILERRTFGHRSFQEITGFKNLDELQVRVDRYATRLTKEECLDLPPKTYVRRDVELTDEQRALYKKVAADIVVQMESGAIDAPRAITKALRLQQIVSGHVTTMWMDEHGEETTALERVPSRRLAALGELLAEVRGKVIVWAHWRPTIEDIEKYLVGIYGRDAVAAIHGDVGVAERQAICERFQDPKDPLRYLVGNPSVAGYGLNLTEGRTVVYFTRDFRLETRIQSEDRSHRIGQQGAVTYYDLISPDTIDEKVLDALIEKHELSTKVLGDKLREWLKAA